MNAHVNSGTPNAKASVTAPTRTQCPVNGFDVSAVVVNASKQFVPTCPTSMKFDRPGCDQTGVSPVGNHVSTVLRGIVAQTPRGHPGRSLQRVADVGDEVGVVSA